MSEPLIEVKNLSKRYKLGQIQGYKTFRESFQNVFKHRKEKENVDYIWALKDVSFDVKEGEVLGIIGRNGAGKTTMLKILSRITKPTEGEIKLRGRVASLLEVGTGFHPELTGRENIFLNGAILNMKRAEIQRKFDDIVDFAEVEKFIDTPVKRYSSGMYVRLAFAVAAHLNPEILLVDEVLAVGDASFQKKCLGKMGDVAKKGRTVLFVSHNMEAIRRLCPRVILIYDGIILSDDTSETVISEYLSKGGDLLPSVRYYDSATAPGDDYVRLRSIRIVNKEGHVASGFKINENISVETEFTVLQPISNFHIYLRVFTQDGILAFSSGDWDDASMEISQFLPGRYVASCVIPANLLNRGIYALTVIGQVPHIRYVFMEENVLRLEILEIDGAGGAISMNRPGVFRPKLKWNVERAGTVKKSRPIEL